MALEALNQVEMNEVSGGATVAITNTAGMLDGTTLNFSPTAIVNFVFGQVANVFANISGLLGGLLSSVPRLGL